VAVFVSKEWTEKPSEKIHNTMAGLKTWFDQKWVDIGSKRKDGSFAKCGRSKQKADAKRKYPKCVPLAKATRMSDSQRASAVRRKRAASNVGPKPTNVATFAKRKKMGFGGLVWRNLKCHQQAINEIHQWTAWWNKLRKIT